MPEETTAFIEHKLCPEVAVVLPPLILALLSLRLPVYHGPSCTWSQNTYTYLLARALHSPQQIPLFGGQIMRYEVTTTLSPQAAIAYAKNYFGPQGVGLEVIDEQTASVTLIGGGGHVSVVACSGEKKTTLELETREWDYPVRQFMHEVS